MKRHHIEETTNACGITTRGIAGRLVTCTGHGASHGEENPLDAQPSPCGSFGAMS